MSNIDVSRRSILKAGTLGAIAVVGGISEARAGVVTPAETEGVRIVKDFCEAWNAHDLARLSPFIADNCAVRWSERQPWTSGREAVIAKIKQLLDTTQKVELQVVETYPKGPLVLNERIDSTTRAGKVNSHRLVGTFFIQNGKIAEWSDYSM